MQIKGNHLYKKVSRNWKRLLDFICRIGPFGPLLFLMASELLLFSFFRLIFTMVYFNRLKEEPRFLMLFPLGFRMDLVIVCYSSMLFLLLLVLIPKKALLKIRWIFLLPVTLFMCFFLYMESCTITFIQEFDIRPDRIFIEYLKHPKEILSTLFAAYKLPMFITVVLLVFYGGFTWKTFSILIHQYKPWGLWKRLIIFPFAGVLLFLGGRGSLGHRAANISTVSFSNNHLVNEMALNSSYTVLYAVYRLRHEKNPSLIYGSMDKEEIIKRVKANLTVLNEDFIESEIPFLHHQKSPVKADRPRNVVIFLQESLGAEYVSCLNGLPLTPNICRLKDEGLWFKNLYATGTRTIRGIEATVCGFLPTPSRSVVKLGLARHGFFNAALLFKQHNYTTEFIYGGMSNFDEMRSFFISNGFQKIYDKPTFENPVSDGVWGVSDEDLVRKAHEVFKSHGDKPFFALMLSTSNHTPFDFPDGRIELYKKPKEGHENAIKYADYAIGLFFDLAKKADYFKHTIFLVVADHNTRVRGNELVPIHKFHIPGFIIGPDVPKMEYKDLVSQIDLLPTLLHFTGLDTIHPMIGRNLMTLPPGTPGRALMQYSSHYAYQVDNQVVIFKPYKEPLQFKYTKKKLKPVELDPDFANDALAHSLLPWMYLA